MSVRVLLAVVFAVVLLSVVGPAVEDARDARTRAAATRAADAIVDGARNLVEGGEPPPRGIAGATRTVAVDLPPAAALVVSNGSRILRTTVDGRRVDTMALPVPVHLPESESGPKLSIQGRTTLYLQYERRVSGPVIVLTRGFIRETEARKGYVVTPGAGPSRVRPRISRAPVRLYRRADPGCPPRRCH